ncbi:Gfo/Idh/MocA family protein [[Actinomadura] parvosata]|uniref:Gfo/Idh/MocA family protein n=1 Tax=[Actinomadura] parvosata TaxID=1955412 RepID=UPI00406CE496
MSWRLQRERAGSGALGDLGSHIVDLTQYLSGELITSVSATTTTFIQERPLPDGQGTGLVTVDDAALFTGRLGSGALASFEATRFASGRKNALRIELNGELGSVTFDLERLNELRFHDHAENPQIAGFRRVLVTESTHPYLSGWWPPGHVLGWEHTFTHEVADLLTAIAADTDPAPSFADGLQVQRVLAAVSESAEHESRWTPVVGADHPGRSH